MLMDVGLELRQARERRGISLPQLSSITKISPRVLQAIEASDAARLPAPVYTKSFVRTYASEIGLDPEETLSRYLGQFEPEDAGEQQPAAVTEPSEPPRDAPRRSPARVLHGRFGDAAAIAFVIIALVALVGRQYAQHQPAIASSQASVAAAGLVPVETPLPHPVGTTGTSPTEPLHITISPTGPCWVQATEGENRLFATLLNAGERRTVDSASEVTLRVGDPAAFAFTINGKPARITGAAGQAITVHITKENVGQFLAL